MNRSIKAVLYVVSIVGALAIIGLSADSSAYAAETNGNVTDAHTALSGYQFVKQGVSP
jgi:hypothetical protein